MDSRLFPTVQHRCRQYCSSAGNLALWDIEHCAQLRGCSHLKISSPAQPHGNQDATRRSVQIWTTGQCLQLTDDEQAMTWRWRMEEKSCIKACAPSFLFFHPFSLAIIPMARDPRTGLRWICSKISNTSSPCVRRIYTLHSTIYKQSCSCRLVENYTVQFTPFICLRNEL